MLCCSWFNGEIFSIKYSLFLNQITCVCEIFKNMGLIWKSLSKKDITYTWIYWQGKTCRQFSLLILIWNLIYWSVHSSSRRWRVGWSISVFLSSCQNHFIRVYENLVQHPCNYISINAAIGSRDQGCSPSD